MSPVLKTEILALRLYCSRPLLDCWTLALVMHHPPTRHNLHMQAVATKLSGCSSTIKTFPDSVCFRIVGNGPVFIPARVWCLPLSLGTKTEGGTSGADKSQ